MRLACVSVIFLANIVHLIDGLAWTPPRTVRVWGSNVNIQFDWSPDMISASIFLQAALGDDECEVYNYAYISSSTTTKLNFKRYINPGDKVNVRVLVDSKETIKVYNVVYTIKANGIGEVDVKPKATCKPAPHDTQTERPTTTCDKLIFEDNFNNGQNLLHNWAHEVIYRNLAPCKEFVAFVNDPINSNITDNKLHITMTDGTKQGRIKLHGCTGTGKNINEYYECGADIKPNTLAFIKRSANLYSRFTFKYGRIEISAQMPKGDWVFPNILLEPKVRTPWGTPKDQIRLYSRGNQILQNRDYLYLDGRSLFGSVLVWHGANRANWKPSEYWTIRESKDQYFWSDLHNYTIIWQEDIISFKVNGIHFGDITNRALLERFNKHECHIVLGLTAGGTHNFDDEVILPGHKDFTNTDPKAEERFNELNQKSKNTPLIVDNIRVYKMNDC